MCKTKTRSRNRTDTKQTFTSILQTIKKISNQDTINTLFNISPSSIEQSITEPSLPNNSYNFVIITELSWNGKKRELYWCRKSKSHTSLGRKNSRFSPVCLFIPSSLASANQGKRSSITKVITTRIHWDRMVSIGHDVLLHRGSNKPHTQWVHVDLSPSFDKNVKQPSTVTFELSSEWVQLCFQAPYDMWMFEVVLKHIKLTLLQERTHPKLTADEQQK